MKWGEIQFGKGDIMHRCHSINNVIRELSKTDDFSNLDAIFYEDAIFVQNKSSVIKLSMGLAAAVSPLAANGVKTIPVRPLVWQSYIGNKVLTKAEKESIKKKFPGKSPSWYQNKNREFRKGRTMDWVKENFGVQVATDNVSDAIGIGYWGSKNV